MKLLFILLVLIRLFSVGVREGLLYTDYKWDKWYLDYHFIRTIDVIIFGILLSYLIGFWIALGTLMFGYCLIYERALQYISYKKLFYPQKPWKIFKWEIPIKNWHMVVLGIIGLLVVILNLV